MAEITLELTPSSRFDVIDISDRINEAHDGFQAKFRKAIYCSHHTTAGYYNQHFLSGLDHNSDSIRSYISNFQHMFPERADYQHDQLHLRTELTEEQKVDEPLNGDSHLTFIGSGLENCVTYFNSNTPVYFVDLDGMYRGHTRRRRTTILGYDNEACVETFKLPIPVSKHRIDSVNLRDPRHAFFDQLQERVVQHGIQRGRIDISLSAEENQAALTVNEYETLLMRHDLAEVLLNPMRFVAQKGWHMLKDPRAVPNKMLNYAKYDLVQVVNRALDKWNMGNSLVGRGLQHFLANHAARALRLRRSISLLVTSQNGAVPSIVCGTYQSPILVQWCQASNQTREVEVRLIKFE